MSCGAPMRSDRDRLLVLLELCRAVGLPAGPGDIETPTEEFPFFGVVTVGIPIVPDVLDHALFSAVTFERVMILLWWEKLKHFYSSPIPLQRDSWNREIVLGAFHPGHMALWSARTSKAGDQ